MTAVPREACLVLANPADRPMTAAYEQSMPTTETRKRGRRPKRSQLTEAVVARMRFQRAARVNQCREIAAGSLTQTRIDKGYLNRLGDSNRFENRTQVIADDSIPHPVEGECQSDEHTDALAIARGAEEVEVAARL